MNITLIRTLAFPLPVRRDNILCTSNKHMSQILVYYKLAGFCDSPPFSMLYLDAAASDADVAAAGC